MRSMLAGLVVITSICAIAGCENKIDIPEKHSWIGDNPSDRWAMTASQFRGLDVAMVEVDYRYQELYWAGKDSNWAYADSQQAKVALALENALIRRPKRRASSENIFDGPLADVGKAINRQDVTEFETAITQLTAACNACHAAEGVPSFTVQAPIDRQSSIAPAR